MNRIECAVRLLLCCVFWVGRDGTNLPALMCSWSKIVVFQAALNMHTLTLVINEPALFVCGQSPVRCKSVLLQLTMPLLPACCQEVLEAWTRDEHQATSHPRILYSHPRHYIFRGTVGKWKIKVRTMVKVPALLLVTCAVQRSLLLAIWTGASSGR